jgi:cytochrome c oxidase cbb3-type subunit III
MTATRRLFAIVICAAVLPACGRNDIEAKPKAPASPPQLRTAVGPVPGPGENAPRPGNPYSGNRQAAGQGKQLFMRMNCAGCHGDHAGGGMGPSLRDVDWIYGTTEAQIFSSIAEGRAHGMPSWGTKLNEDDIWKLVAYIKTLRTRNEIQPPEPQ